MSNYIKGCGCRQCRRASVRKRLTFRKVIRRLRRLTKMALRLGKEPPGPISVPYTD